MKNLLDEYSNKPENEWHDDVGPVGGHVVDDEQRERCHCRQQLKQIQLKISKLVKKYQIFFIVNSFTTWFVLVSINPLQQVWSELMVNS